MEWIYALMLQVASTLVIIGIAWGIMSAKVKAMQEQICQERERHEQRFRDIETNHKSSMDILQNQMNVMNNTMNQMIGRLDMFFKMKGVTHD